MTETCAEIRMFVVRVVHILRNPVCRPPCGETRRTAVIGCRFPAVVTAARAYASRPRHAAAGFMRPFPAFAPPAPCDASAGRAAAQCG